MKIMGWFCHYIGRFITKTQLIKQANVIIGKPTANSTSLPNYSRVSPNKYGTCGGSIKKDNSNCRAFFIVKKNEAILTKKEGENVMRHTKFCCWRIIENLRKIVKYMYIKIQFLLPVFLQLCGLSALYKYKWHDSIKTLFSTILM